MKIKDKHYKILILGSTLVTLLYVRILSQNSASAETVESKPALPKVESKPLSFEEKFGPEALGKTFYAINPEYTCLKDGKKVPSWEDSLYLDKSGKVFLLGDRCSQKETEIRDITTVHSIADGSAIAYRTHIYDRFDSIPNYDPGLNAQRFTEAFCTLDHESMPGNDQASKTDLRFHVYNSSAPNSASFVMGTGETPKEWSVAITLRPLFSRTIAERVLLYQFNAEYSAYVSLPGAILNHSSLFTAYDSKKVQGTGRGQCFLNPYYVPTMSEKGDKVVATIPPRWK